MRVPSHSIVLSDVYALLAAEVQHNHREHLSKEIELLVARIVFFDSALCVVGQNG